MVPTLAFDIETIPDVAGIRRLHDLPADLPDREVPGIEQHRLPNAIPIEELVAAHRRRVAGILAERPGVAPVPVR